MYVLYVRTTGSVCAERSKVGGVSFSSPIPAKFWCTLQHIEGEGGVGEGGGGGGGVIRLRWLSRGRYLIDERDFLCLPENALRTLFLAPLEAEGLKP